MHDRVHRASLHGTHRRPRGCGALSPGGRSGRDDGRLGRAGRGLARAGRAEPDLAVGAHVLDDGDEGTALLGERVLDPRRHRGVRRALDDALLLERTQAQRQRARADAGERALELAEARTALGELTDEEQRPLAAHDVGGAADGTALIDGHASTLPSEVATPANAPSRRAAPVQASRAPGCPSPGHGASMSSKRASVRARTSWRSPGSNTAKKPGPAETGSPPLRHTSTSPSTTTRCARSWT